MKKISIGNKLYFSVLSVFILFAAAFIVFQQTREKQYKTDWLNMQLQDYNARMAEAMHYMRPMSEEALNLYVRRHATPELRVTIINRHGKVIYDSRLKSYTSLPDHSTRPEVQTALSTGSGYTVERNSTTLNDYFFYSATYFKDKGLVVRSALPYDDNLAESLRADQHYIWFALSAVALLTLILYRFTSRLGDNINKLRLFASRADHGESLDTEDLVAFPDDELGEIAEKIIKIYKRLQTTRKEQDELKRQLTQNIAHELKTPVASIQGYLETILSNPRIDEPTRQQFLQRCFAQSQRLTALLTDISTLNRLDDAPGLIEFGDVDIAAIIAAISKETALQLKAKHMAFVCNMPPAMPVNGSHSLLYSIFRNLTDNAIAYAGDSTTITISATDGGDAWLFTFCDNGIGVSAEHLPRLFERFYRIDKGRSRKMGGTGLGLAIVKNAVLLHGGTIAASNLPTGGLCFKFSITKGGRSTDGTA